MKRWLPFWTLLLSLAACAPGTASTPTPSAVPPLWEGITPIGEILSDLRGYEGREVTVIAYYRGWDLFGEAGSGPPLTRSDVAVADATGGIYIVSGEGFEGFQGAPSLPPARPEATETLLRIRGVVRIGPSGQPYIEVVEGERVEGLPLGVVLRVRRYGTLMGLNEELMVQADGTAYFLDRKASYTARFSVDPQEVAQVLDEVGRHLSEGEVGTPIPDTAVYDFTVWEGETVHTLRVFEWESPLTEAVEIVARWCDQGRAGEKQPDIRGVITTISPGQGDVLGTVRIEGSITEGTEYDKAVVTVTEETEVLRRGPEGEERASFDDLQVGQRVEATFEGPVAESYPVQAEASEIVILEMAELPSPGEEESPLPGPGISPLSPLPRPSSEIADTVVSYLAARLGVSPDEVSLLSLEPVQWRDTSLGCPQPGVMYAQVIVPGYRAILEAEGKQYEVHTDEQGSRFVSCGGEEEAWIAPEEAFQTVYDHLTGNYPGFGLNQQEWTRMDATPHTPGFSVVLYRGGEWDLQLDFPLTPRPAYQATLSHNRAGRVWGGMVGPDGSILPAGVQPSLSFKVGPCEGPDISPKVEVTAEGETIHIEQDLPYVCCAELALSAGQDGEVIKVIETNVGEVCRCMCSYHVTVDLADLSPGTYTVQVWGVQHFDVHPLELLGSGEVTIP